MSPNIVVLMDKKDAADFCKSFDSICLESYESFYSVKKEYPQYSALLKISKMVINQIDKMDKYNIFKSNDSDKIKMPEKILNPGLIKDLLKPTAGFYYDKIKIKKIEARSNELLIKNFILSYIIANYKMGFSDKFSVTKGDSSIRGQLVEKNDNLEFLITLNV